MGLHTQVGPVTVVVYSLDILHSTPGCAFLDRFQALPLVKMWKACNGVLLLLLTMTEVCDVV